MPLGGPMNQTLGNTSNDDGPGQLSGRDLDIRLFQLSIKIPCVGGVFRSKDGHAFRSISKWKEAE